MEKTCRNERPPAVVMKERYGPGGAKYQKTVAGWGKKGEGATGKYRWSQVNNQGKNKQSNICDDNDL